MISCMISRKQVRALSNSDSRVNAMLLICTKNSELRIWKINIGAQKIDKSILEIYKMVLAFFFLKDKLRQIWFFEEIFLVPDIRIQVILEILFFLLSNANIWFAEIEKLT